LRRADRLIALLATLHGAGGVALAAAAAHIDASATLATASQFLMVHAAAGLALAALADRQDAPSRWLVGAALALQTGVTLFSLDLAQRAFGHGRLFPYAAPIGGSLTIASWLALSGWAAARALRRES
jgi:uncharacterized membrane protein YgdD (TMEM256/DUF423 family)